MRSTIQYHRNLTQGVNLSISDGEQQIHFETGDRKNSHQFWKDLLEKAQYIVQELEKELVPVHVIVINKGKVAKRKTYKS